MESIFVKFQKEICVALALVLLGAGFTATSEKEYNPYESRVKNVDLMMQDLIKNPTEERIDSAFTLLSLQGDWAFRQSGEQKVTFEAYLEACNDVRLDIKNGINAKADIKTMESLRDDLI